MLCADVSDSMVGHGLEILGRIVEAGKLMGGLFHLYEPLVIAERRTLHTRDRDSSTGFTREWLAIGSAL